MEAGGEIDAWMLEGGLVVTASDRAARALTAAFYRARRGEGLAAWPAPNILDWRNFARAQWAERSVDGRLLLNPTQEQALWADIAGRERAPATLLEGPRRRLAALAMEAHGLLAAHAPKYLTQGARAGWQQDAEAFSGWLAAFDETCRGQGLFSLSRLPLELVSLLKADSAQRPPLLVAGFDRILPVQRELFEAWGAWRQAYSGEAAAEVRFHEAADAQAELAACALWCKRRLGANPRGRLLIVTQDATNRRGEMERAFLQHIGAGPGGPIFEFSLGVPLSRVALARGANLLLRWLTGSIAEHELDWLLSTGQAAASPQESAALLGAMRELRRRSLERPEWSLPDFISQRPVIERLPDSWVQRMKATRLRLDAHRSLARSPLDWAALVLELLSAAGWPGERPLSSAEFQAVRRWQEAVDACGSLGFDGRRIGWNDFLAALAHTLDETLFAPESRDAPIQIAGPAESAGLTADAIWFLGANENAWPAGGATNPLLPAEVQREAGMPHATPQLDWELARAITARLLASAAEVQLSYARQSNGTESRPSRLAMQLAGSPQPLPAELAAPQDRKPLTEAVYDSDRIPFVAAEATIRGGAGILTAQSQCPFQAFATVRLGAQDWVPAEAGLTARQRGSLLHAVLHSIWGGKPDGLRSHRDLLDVADRRSFAAGHVSRVLLEEITAGMRRRMPRRYLDLEEMRLARLVGEWLDYEAARHDFAVVETEAGNTKEIAGLMLRLRLDRVDRLNDGSLLVIDYKSGNVSPSCWDLPRPEDVQLPLYAGFGIDRNEDLGGLVFAKVRAGGLCFAGRVGNAQATLLADLSGGSSLVKNQLTAEQLIDWRDAIEQLAQDFLAGYANVDPRDPPKTCERCGLHTLCRIGGDAGEIEADEGEDGADE